MNQQVRFCKGSPFWSEVVTLLQGVTMQRCFVPKYHTSLTPIRLRGIVVGCLESESPRSMEGFAKDMTLPGYVTFGMGHSVDSITPVDDNLFLRGITTMTIGLAYEKIKEGVERTFGTRKEADKKWPSLYNFCRHVRNGAVHNNKWLLGNGIRIGWRKMELVGPESEKVVIGQGGGGLGLGDVLCLLSDIEQQGTNDKVIGSNNER